jgi:hypothetical protein
MAQSFLNKFVSILVNYSHISLFQYISENIPYINYLSAFCWAFIQACLTYHFFPEILQFISSTFLISVSFQYHLLIVAVASTFITIYMIGLSVLSSKNNQKSNIVNSINKLSDESDIMSFSILVILLVTHFLSYGYMAEWSSKLTLLFHLPLFVNNAICCFAIINLLFFSLERCISSLDYIKTKASDIDYRNILMFISIHVTMFGLLGIFNLSNIVIASSAIMFILSYYLKEYDDKKSFSENLDNILNDWVFLIMHSVSEGAIVGAGVYISLQPLVPNTMILKYLTGVVIAASTICEEMEDLVHDHDDDICCQEIKQDNLSIMTVDKLITFNLTLICLYMLLGAGYSSIGVLYFAAIVNVLLLGSFFTIKENFTLSSTDFSLILIDKIKDNIIYFTCMVTALCVGINGGLEFYHVFGTNINIVFLLALAGLVVESLVYFDQIRKDSSENHEHEHGKLGLFSFLTNIDNLIVSCMLIGVSYAMSNMLFVIPNISYGVCYAIVFSLVSTFGKEIHLSVLNNVDQSYSREFFMLILGLGLAIYFGFPLLNIANIFTINTLSYLPVLFLLPIISAVTGMSNKSSNHFEHVMPNSSSNFKQNNSTNGQTANSQQPVCNGKSCCNGQRKFISDEQLKKLFKGPVKKVVKGPVKKIV